MNDNSGGGWIIVFFVSVWALTIIYMVTNGFTTL